MLKHNTQFLLFIAPQSYPTSAMRDSDQLKLKRKAGCCGRYRGGHAGSEEETFGRVDLVWLAPGCRRQTRSGADGESIALRFDAHDILRESNHVLRINEDFSIVLFGFERHFRGYAYCQAVAREFPDGKLTIVDACLRQPIFKSLFVSALCRPSPDVEAAGRVPLLYD